MRAWEEGELEDEEVSEPCRGPRATVEVPGEPAGDSAVCPGPFRERGRRPCLDNVLLERGRL